MVEFCIEMEVRDYECDMGFVVNNSVYNNYLEHGRHVFMKSEVDIDFFDLCQKKIFFVLVESNFKYHKSLRSGDQFKVTTKLTRISKLRFHFDQAVKRNDGALILTAVCIAVPVSSDDKPYLPTEIDEKYVNYLSKKNV